MIFGKILEKIGGIKPFFERCGGDCTSFTPHLQEGVRRRHERSEYSPYTKVIHYIIHIFIIFMLYFMFHILYDNIYKIVFHL